MAYVALYRKKRPKRFDGVVGQAHIVRTLLNQLAAGHISHAYLFCGTRGTGKTSTAKIFARAVNCEQPQSGEPCNICAACEGILAERSLNVIEIDAASNNGVENIRDLREEVRYPPAEGKYKVYIIDEAHMLTTSAFNALLKTLEEPPPHVVFILATTDPQKIPATILSRCQRYDFKRITVGDMTETLKAYMQNEAVAVAEAALRYIASVSDGAMRDALSILDQCLSFYAGEDITVQKVLTLLGAVDQQVLFDFTDALRRFDSLSALSIIDGIVRDGRDVGHFVADMVGHFRNLLVAAQTAGSTGILDYADETVERFRAQGEAFEKEQLIGYIRKFSELQSELRYVTHDRLALEVCAIRLCHPAVETQMEAVFARLAKLEQTIAQMESRPQVTPPQDTPPQDIPPQATQPQAKPLQVTQPQQAKPPQATRPQKQITDETMQTIKSEWAEFCRRFENPVRSMLSICSPERAGDGMMYLVCGDQASMKFLKEKHAAIMEAMTAQFGINPNAVLFTTRDDAGKRGKHREHDLRALLNEQINMDIEFM